MKIVLPPSHRIRNFKEGDTEGPLLFKQATTTLGEVFQAPVMCQTAALTPLAWTDLERRTIEQDMMATVRELYEIQRWFINLGRGASNTDGVPLMSYTQDLARRYRGEDKPYFEEEARQYRIFSAHRITKEVCMRVLVDLGKLDILMHDKDGYEAFADTITRAQYRTDSMMQNFRYLPKGIKRDEFMALADHLHDQLKIYEHALGVEVPETTMRNMVVDPINVHGAQRWEELLRGQSLDDLRRNHFHLYGMKKTSDFLKQIIMGDAKDPPMRGL